MGPATDVQVPTPGPVPAVESPEAPPPATHPRPRRWLPTRPGPLDQPTLLGSSVTSRTGRLDRNLRFPDWLYRSQAASVLWLVVRLWLGYEWLNAGYQKIWGSERSAFWFGGGAGVKGFAAAGVAGSATGKGGASYGWWAGFLHNFVVPNASWIGRAISLGELAIGIGLILGLLTGAAALAGLTLNIVYMLSGSAGVNPVFGLLAVLLVLAWRNAGWIGLDRFVLNSAWRQRHLGTKRLSHRPVPVVATPH
jgi:thiosulfate dehydrogenase (quinone) large subunit